MTRLFEIIVALILVVVLAVVVGVLLPAQGHVQRSIEVSHDLRHTYDALNNFRKFREYSALAALDPRIEFTLDGPAYGPGAEITWHSSGNIDDGSLRIDSAAEDRQVVWGLTSDWRGSNKRYTIDLEPSDNGKIVKVVMSYDVDYGWNLIDRYSKLYLHGDPATFMQYTLGGLQSTLASIPNVGYKTLDPVLMDTPEQPVLYLSTQSERTLEDIAFATEQAVSQIRATMKDLGVEQAGPYATMTTDWGDTTYLFDVYVPISSTELKFGDRVVDLRDVPAAKSLAEQNLEAARSDAEGDAGDEDDAAAAMPGTGPGSFRSDGSLTVDERVRGKIAFGGRALAAAWHGSPARLPSIWLALKAYAATHGYEFNEYAQRMYDVDISDADNNTVDDRELRIYLPVSTSPEETPWQIENPAEAAKVVNMESTAETDGATGTETDPTPEADANAAPAGAI